MAAFNTQWASQILAQEPKPAQPSPLNTAMDAFAAAALSGSPAARQSEQQFLNDTTGYDPYATGGYSSGGGSGGGSTANPSDLAYLDSQQAALERQQSRTGTTLTQGLQELLDSYNNTRSDANLQRSRELENLGVQRQDTMRGKDNALDRVNTGARTLAESLRRRLGMAGGSDSSAYQITAPGAVARDASEKRGGVMEDFGANFRNLDTTEKRAKEDYEKLFSSIDADKARRERGLRQGVEGERIRITESLQELARQRALAQGGGYDQVRAAMAPYEAQIAQRESTIDNLFNKYRQVGKFNPVKVNTPELQKYMVDKTAVQANEQAGTQSPYAPYLPQLQDEEEQLV